MRKAIELFHGSFRAVLREPKRVGKRDVPGEFLKRVKDKARLDEYLSLGFPVWERLKLEGIDLPDLDYASAPLCGLEWMIEELDFEGADRKYTLLSDLFATQKLCFEGSGERSFFLEEKTVDSGFFLIEGEAKMEIGYRGDFRVSSARFLLKEGSKLELTDWSSSDGVEISSYYFYLQNGAKLVLNQGVFSRGKIAKFVMVDGEGNFEALVLPRIGALKGAADVMYSARATGSPSVVVSGRGFAKEGRVIFRGVMDAKRGAKGSSLREHFECLFLDEKSSFQAIPSLFVSENELSAEHGATAYQIPYGQTFYLMSRGFSEDEVKKIVASGIFENFEDLRKDLEKAL